MRPFKSTVLHLSLVAHLWGYRRWECNDFRWTSRSSRLPARLSAWITSLSPQRYWLLFPVPPGLSLRFQCEADCRHFVLSAISTAPVKGRRGKADEKVPPLFCVDLFHRKSIVIYPTSLGCMYSHRQRKSCLDKAKSPFQTISVSYPFCPRNATYQIRCLGFQTNTMPYGMSPVLDSATDGNVRKFQAVKRLIRTPCNFTERILQLWQNLC